MDQTLHIDFGEIHKIAKKGINRTILFLGLGLNAGHSPTFDRYQLDEHSAIQLVPQDLDGSTLSAVKVEFCRWIQANGLRELIESFCIYLDNLHGACLQLEIVMTNSERSWKNAQKAYENGSFEYKMKELSERFKVCAPNQECLTSIYRARNCLSHRHGIVGKQDCRADTALMVHWFWYKLTAVLEDGQQFDVELPIREPIHFDPPGRIHAVWQEKSRRFDLGSFVDFTPQELTEICVFVDRIAELLRESAVQYAIGLGVTVEDKLDSHSQEQNGT